MNGLDLLSGRGLDLAAVVSLLVRRGWNSYLCDSSGQALALTARRLRPHERTPVQQR